jgi:hypothetical protein
MWRIGSYKIQSGVGGFMASILWFLVVEINQIMSTEKC